MPDTAFAVSSLDGIFLSVDRGFCDVIQRDLHDVLGQTILAVTLGKERANNAAKLDLLRGTGEPFTIQKHYLGTDGRVIAVSNRVSMLRDGIDQRKIVAHVTALRESGVPVNARDLLGVANAIAGERQLRATKIDPRWRNGIAWQVVLAAYISEMEGRAGDTAEVLFNLHGPPDLATRTLRYLAQEGVLVLEDHIIGDASRSIVRLTIDTLQTLEDHLTTLCG